MGCWQRKYKLSGKGLLLIGWPGKASSRTWCLNQRLRNEEGVREERQAVQSLRDPKGLQHEKEARVAGDGWAAHRASREGKQLGLCPLEVIPSSYSNSQEYLHNVNIKGHQRKASPCSVALQLLCGSLPLSPTPLHRSDPHSTSVDVPQEEKEKKRNILMLWIFVMCQALSCAFYYLCAKEVVGMLLLLLLLPLLLLLYLLIFPL